MPETPLQLSQKHRPEQRRKYALIFADARIKLQDNSMRIAFCTQFKCATYSLHGENKCPESA